MNKLLTFLVLFPLIACSTPSGSSRIDTAQQTVNVYDQARTYQGSGVVVKVEALADGMFDIYVLTAGHIVKDGDEQNFELWWGDDQVLLTDVGVLVSMHESEDAALVKFTDDEPFPVARLSFRLPRPGERVLAAGYPLDEFWFDEGLIVTATKMSAQLTPGNSGGPVISLGGSVIGIGVGVEFYRVTAGPHWAHQNHMASYVSLSSLEDWLREQGMVE